MSPPVVSNRNADALGQRTICSTLLVVLVIGFVGLPLAQTTPPKAGRFPCENCPCGCSTATFCWDTCCCFSDSEKLDWAAKNGVTPPDFLITRVAATAVKRAAVTAGESAPKSCCGCGGGSDVSSPERCEIVAQASGSATCQSTPDAATADAAPNVLRLIRLESVAKCRGLELVWSLFSAVVVDVSLATTAKPEPPLLFVMPIADERADSSECNVDPPVP